MSVVKNILLAVLPAVIIDAIEKICFEIQIIAGLSWDVYIPSVF